MLTDNILKYIFLVILYFATQSIFSQEYFSKEIPLYDGTDIGWNIITLDDGYLIGAGSIAIPENIEFTRIVKIDLKGNLVWKRDYKNFPMEFGLGGVGSLASIGDSLFTLTGEYYYSPDYYNRYRMFLNNQGDSISFIIDSLPYNSSGGKIEIIGIRIGYFGFQKIEDGTSHPRLTVTNLEGKIVFDTIYTDKVNRVSGNGFFDACLDKSYILSFGEANQEPKYIMKVDSNGDEIFFKRSISNELGGSPPFVKCLNDGTYITATINIDTFQPWPYANFVHLIERFSPDGSLIWEHYIKQPFLFGTKRIWNIEIAENGDIIGIGRHTHGIDTLIPNLHSFGAWIFRMSGDTGEMLWERVYHYPDGHEGSTLYSLSEDDEGNIICVGRISDTIPGSDGLTNTNIWVLKLDPDGCLDPGCQDSLFLITSLSESNQHYDTRSKDFFSVNPNPAKNFISIYFLKRLTGNNWQLRVHSLTGKLIYNQPVIKGTDSVKIPTYNFKQGIYFVSLLNSENKLQNKKLIIHK